MKAEYLYYNAKDKRVLLSGVNSGLLIQNRDHAITWLSDTYKDLIKVIELVDQFYSRISNNPKEDIKQSFEGCL